MRNRLSRNQVKGIQAAIAAGEADSQIARRLGVAGSTVRKIRLGDHSRLWGADWRPPGTIGYVPSPAEIEAACAELRQQKLEAEPEPWLPPGCDGRLMSPLSC